MKRGIVYRRRAIKVGDRMTIGVDDVHLFGWIRHGSVGRDNVSVVPVVDDMCLLFVVDAAPGLKRSFLVGGKPVVLLVRCGLARQCRVISVVLAKPADEAIERVVGDLPSVGQFVNENRTWLRVFAGNLARIR